MSSNCWITWAFQVETSLGNIIKSHLKIKLKRGDVVVHACNPITGKVEKKKKEDLYFKANLGYFESSGLSLAT